MNFEEFWKRQQYTDDANDKEFAREAWELATDIEREACAVIANDYATCGVLDGTAQATAEAIEKTIKNKE